MCVPHPFFCSERSGPLSSNLREGGSSMPNVDRLLAGGGLICELEASFGSLSIVTKHILPLPTVFGGGGGVP